VCSKCVAGLDGVLNQANSSHVFIAVVLYQDLPTGGLIVPSSYLTGVCTLIEAKFRNNIEKIPHISKASSILVTLMLSKIQEKLECDSCKTLRFVVHLYNTIRHHHVLLVNSREFKCCKGKENRKRLKLRHC